jgi:hypothetical protein
MEPNDNTPKNAEEKMEQPVSDSGTPGVEPSASESTPVQAEKRKMGRFQRFLRTALIALGVILVVFLAGFLTDHFARYRPTKAALDQAQQSVSDLTTQLEAANDRIAVLEPDLESATSHVELLGTLVELKTAHFELKNGNLAATKVALSGTAARLENLKPLVETVDATLAGNMLTRLDLIMNGMDNSPASALVDLELLFTNLQSVETLLFGE